MKAIVRTRYGSPDILELKEVDKPAPTDNQALVKIHATSVNPLDWHVLRGEPFLVRLMGFGVLKPKHQILGADMAGRVEAVGKNVTQFKVGDEVFGSSMGGFAEYACVCEDKLVLKPAAMTFEQAAAVPVAGIYAYFTLVDQGLLMAVDILDGVFDGNNVAGTVGVAVIDQCGQGGRFARAGSADKQHQHGC